MTRITIANQSVICNNDEITDTVYFTTDHELIEYALINNYYDCHVYYTC